MTLFRVIEPYHQCLKRYRRMDSLDVRYCPRGLKQPLFLSSLGPINVP